MKRNISILIIAITLLAISIFFFPFHCSSKVCKARQEVPPAIPKAISIGGETVQLEIADTNVLREQGLSGRSELPEGRGMLFVFDTPGREGFWMKDMKFALDIIWLDEKGVVSIKESASPDSYPQVFYPEMPAKFVLEVPAGFSLRHGLKTGSPFTLF